VKTLAGHSSFATTHEFCLAVADDLVDCAGQATARSIGEICCKTVADGYFEIQALTVDVRSCYTQTT
jgi:hypothetical protein